MSTDSPLLRTLAENVRRYRLEADLSQERYAHDLGVHRTYLGGVERGERNLTLKSVEELARRMGVEARDLLFS